MIGLKAQGFEIHGLAEVLLTVSWVLDVIEVRAIVLTESSV